MDSNYATRLEEGSVLAIPHIYIDVDLGGWYRVDHAGSVD